MRIGPNPVGTVSALIALAGITQTISTQAAIVVSSVSNLEIPFGESTTVDFDGNGTPEFYFYYANTQVILESYDNSAVSIYSTDTGRLQEFALGSPITMAQPTTVFTGAELPLAGPFYGGFQFQIDGNTHLGWFQLENMGELSVVRILNAAWQTLPETGLNAGAVPELPATPLVFGAAAGLTFWWLRRPTRPGHGSA
ncbi:MAG: hypothetical protein J0M24_02885 [Verrucomicrobia bacterium]|nr:hypothetical protein [Verrucomicrobiota bacterium]